LCRLGQFLGLPIPACGLVYKAGQKPEHYFASLNFNLSSSQLPPIDANSCGALSDGTGVILFDILIANDDRHRANLSLDSSTQPPQLTVFDHSHALFGHANGVGRDRLIALRENLGIIDGTRRHCLLGTINNDQFFKEWIDRINGLPDYLIDQVCEATVPLNMISGAEAAEAKAFLKYRKAEISKIIERNKAEFTAIPQWSLF